MNKRFITLALSFLIAALAARADLNIEAVVAEAKADAANAPAVVAKAATENPDKAVELVSAAVTAIPEKVIEIVCAVCKGLPKLSPELVRAALDIYKDRSAEIVVGIADCVPPEVLEALAAPTNRDEPYFPPQPTPDPIVSPSS